MNVRNGAFSDDPLLERVRVAAAALAGPGYVFLEHREDLTIEASGTEPTRTRHVTSRGMSRTEGESLTFESQGDDPAAGPGLDVEGARRWVERLRGFAGRDAAIAYAASDQKVWIGRHGGAAVSDRRRGARVRLEIRTSQGGRAVADAVWRAGRDPDPESLAMATAHRARARSEAVRPPLDAMPVVFAPGVAGIVIHELVGHALEEDVVRRGASWLAAQRGDVAASGIRIVDDPRRARIPWKVDDTGEATGPLSLVEDGRVVQHLGGGRQRRSGFTEPTLPRMGCTFITTGSASAADALVGLSLGLYVRRLEAAATDTATGRATFRVTDADLIHEGAIAEPASPCVIRMTASQVLREFEVIAEDLEFDRCLGTCLKDGQPLAVSVGAPTCRLGLVRVHA